MMTKFSILVLSIGLATMTNGSEANGADRGQSRSGGKRVTDRRPDSAKRLDAAGNNNSKGLKRGAAGKRGATDSKRPGQGQAAGNRSPKNNAPDNAQRRARILERFDQNGNGKLDPDERAAAIKELQSRRNDQRGKPGQGKSDQGKSDRGKSRQGQSRQGKSDQGKSGDRRSQILEEFDKNGNGQLDPEEKQAAIKAMRDRRNSKDSGNRKRPGAGDSGNRKRPGAGDSGNRKRPGAGNSGNRKRPGAGTDGKL